MIYAGRFDASALHIAHALKQTEIQKSYNKGLEKPIGEYLVSKLNTESEGGSNTQDHFCNYCAGTKQTISS